MSDAKEAAREVLGGEPAWIVGGAVRDRLLGRADDRPRHRARAATPRPGARASRAAPGHAVRAVGRVRRLARRRPRPRVARRRRAHCATTTSPPTSPPATSRSTRSPSRSPAASWPTRTAAARTSARGGCGWSAPRRSPRTRCARCARPRLANELELERRAGDRRGGARTRPSSRGVAAERVFAELQRIVAGERPVAGLELMEELGPVAVVLPELRRAARRRAERLPPPRRPRPHARGARGRTRLEAGAPELGEHAEAVRGAAGRAAGRRADARRRHALRGPAARRRQARHPGRRPDGRVTFLGHDSEGAELARGVLGACAPRERLASTSPRSPATTCGSASSSTSGRCRAARSGATSARPSLRGRRHAAHRRRPARHPRQNAERGDRGPPELSREMLGAALARRAGAARAARARRRPRRASSGSRRARDRAAARGARGGPVRRRDRTREDAISRARSLLADRPPPRPRAAAATVLEVHTVRRVALRVVVGGHLVLVAGGEHGGLVTRRAAPTARRWRSRGAGRGAAGRRPARRRRRANRATSAS